MKERYAQTEMRKQANRMTFGEVRLQSMSTMTELVLCTRTPLMVAECRVCPQCCSDIQFTLRAVPMKPLLHKKWFKEAEAMY